MRGVYAPSGAMRSVYGPSQLLRKIPLSVDAMGMFRITAPTFLVA
jgi:hypothetical protein